MLQKNRTLSSIIDCRSITNGLKAKIALLSFLINFYHQLDMYTYKYKGYYILEGSTASYLIGHNKYLLQFLAYFKPLFASNFDVI